MKYSVGVDLGSTAIKVVFVQNNTLIWHKAIPTAPGQEALANKVIEEGIRELDISKDDILGVAATGYGAMIDYRVMYSVIFCFCNPGQEGGKQSCPRKASNN